MTTKIKRIRTFIVEGVVIRFYNYGEDYDVSTVHYRHTYDTRVSLDQMWKDIEEVMQGKLYVYSARIDMFVLSPIVDHKYPNAQSVKHNDFNITIPIKHRFDSNIRIG